MPTSRKPRRKASTQRAAPSKPSFGQLAGLRGTDDPLNLRSSVALVIDHRQPPEAVKAAITAAGGKLLVLAEESDDPIADLQAHMNAVIQAL